MTGIEHAVAGAWPLVGRDVELAEIAAARAEPGCPAVVISAGAGVGKSRLAREVCSVANADGAVTLWAQATATSATIPLGALAGLIPDEVRSDDLFELVRRSGAALRSRADGRPVVLAVDDAQLLDPASATLVMQLAAGPELFVVATVRSGEPTPDAVDSLWKDAGARRIELERLSDEAIAELVEAALGGPVEQATMRRIVEVCVGNPLYAHEVVLSAVESGRIRSERGLWRLEGRPGVTPSLTALIKRRIGTLDTELRRMLELVALGEPLRLDELIDLTSFAAIEAGEEREMIVIAGPSDDAEVGLAHPLYGEVIRADLPAVRGRAHRVSLAAMIQRRRPMTPDDALRVTRWLLTAGAEIPNGLLIDAAAAANLSGDPALGAELARRAIDGGGGIRAVLLLATAHMNRNRFEDAEAVLAAAEPSVPGDPKALDYISKRWHVLYWALRRLDETRALLGRVAGWSDDPNWQAGLEQYLTVLGQYEDRSASSLESIRETLSNPSLDPEARRGLEHSEVLALLPLGRMREAQRLALSLRPRMPLQDEFDSYALGLNCMVGAESGEDRAGFRAYLAEVLHAALAGGDHETAGMTATLLATCDLDSGRYRDAVRWLAEADIQLEQKDSFGAISAVRAFEVGVACFMGQPTAARIAIESMRSHIARSGASPVLEIWLACGEGWAARARSDGEGAEVFLERATASTELWIRSKLLYEALRAGARPAPIAQALTELVKQCDSLMIEVRAAHAVALAARDGGALVETGERLAAIGCEAAAIEAIVAGAQEFLAQGREDSARRAAARARELHPPDQGWDPPVIDGLDWVAVELTPRESQIATLAARGAGNQQIADELVLSVRTVETYIYRAMQKRGVSNRRDL